MTIAPQEPPLVALVGEATQGICIGQVAALAALRAEMTALSTLMAGLPRREACATGAADPGARARDPDPDDACFDNMPV